MQYCTAITIIHINSLLLYIVCKFDTLNIAYMYYTHFIITTANILQQQYINNAYLCIQLQCINCATTARCISTPSLH